MDYKNDIRIDENNLEQEWLDLPYQIMEIGEMCAIAKRKMLQKQEAIKTTRSDIILSVSRNPDLMGHGVKATGPNVEAYYRDHPDHIMTKDQGIDAEHEYDILNSAVFAFQAKKMALENLVRLHGIGYYSDPKVKESAEDRQKTRPKKRRGK